MYSFKDNQEEDDQNYEPFFRSQNKLNSIFLSGQINKDNSAYLLFNQSHVQDEESLIDKLEQFDNQIDCKNKEEKKNFFQPTQTEDSDQLINQQRNSIIEEVNEDYQITQFPQKMCQSSVREFSNVSLLQQKNPLKVSTIKEQKKKINFPNFKGLMNSRVQSKNQTSRKEIFKSKIQDFGQSQNRRSIQKSNNSQIQISSSKKLINFSKFGVKKEKPELIQSRFKIQNMWSKKNLKNQQINKEVKIKDQKLIGIIPLNKEKSTSNQGQKLEFSIIQQMAKRDKISNFNFGKFNKQKQLKKQVKKDNFMENRSSKSSLSSTSSVEKDQNKNSRFPFRFEKKSSSKYRLSDSRIKDRQNSSNNFQNMNQVSLYNRLQVKKIPFSESKQMKYYNQMEQLINKTQTLKLRLQKNKRQNQNRFKLLKHLQNILQYGFTEKQSKRK